MKKKLIFIFGLTVIFMNNLSVFAQSPVFNHTTVYVTNLDKSTAFYKNVMQLEKIPDPFKDDRHTWFK